MVGAATPALDDVIDDKSAAMPTVERRASRPGAAIAITFQHEGAKPLPFLGSVVRIDGLSAALGRLLPAGRKAGGLVGMRLKRRRPPKVAVLMVQGSPFPWGFEIV
jgi:hypothetical protein